MDQKKTTTTFSRRKSLKGMAVASLGLVAGKALAIGSQDNGDMAQFDYIIVGAGSAGLLAPWELPRWRMPLSKHHRMFYCMQQMILTLMQSLNS